MNETTERGVLYRCSTQQAIPMAPGTPRQRLPYRTIDVHCHVLAPAVETLLEGHPVKVREAALAVAEMGAVSAATNRESLAALLPQLTSVDRRIADMNAMGVDIQVLSPSPTQFYYWAEPGLSEQIVDLQNESIERARATAEKRFIALGTVSLQTPSRAAEQLKELCEHRGFAGVMISTLVNGKDVSDRFFDPFWTAANDIGAVVFIHPLGSTMGSRLNSHYLINTIGQPLEHTVCLSKLIFSGTFDRHPELKVLAAHGGGYLPTYIQRSDHAYAVRQEARTCACCPSSYLGRIWFDSLVYDTGALGHLAATVGADKVVIGTDYPFDMGHYDPHGLVGDLTPELQRLVLGENAATLLGLPP